MNVCHETIEPMQPPSRRGPAAQRMTRCRAGLTLGLGALLLVGSATFGDLSAQQRRTDTRKTAPSTAPKQKRVSPFTVKAEALTFDKSVANRGEQVTIRFKVRTTGTGTRNIAWRVSRPGASTAQGTRQNVRGGSSFEISVPWTAKLGDQRIEATVDPSNALN
jgi:hypothetical protein